METNEFGRPGNTLRRDETIELDYQSYNRITFYRCRLVFKGGRPPTLIECDFVESGFLFDASALNTLQFLAAIAQDGGEGRELVMNLVGLTRNG